MHGNPSSSTLKRWPCSAAGLLDLRACCMARQRVYILLEQWDDTCTGQLQVQEDPCQHSPVKTWELQLWSCPSHEHCLLPPLSKDLGQPLWFVFVFHRRSSRIPCKQRTQHMPLTPAELGRAGGDLVVLNLSTAA